MCRARAAQPVCAAVLGWQARGAGILACTTVAWTGRRPYFWLSPAPRVRSPGGPGAPRFSARLVGIVMVAAVATAVVGMRRPGAAARGHIRSGMRRAGRPGALGGGCRVTEDARGSGEAIRGPIDASQIPRFADPPTFALLPRRD